MSNKSGLVNVYTACGELEASVIKSKLEEGDIPVLLSYESLGIVYGLSVDGLGEIRILVPKGMAQRAREIIAWGGGE
jgi:hypothetical protein